nr:helix-turn-helix transcriptional regulator [uncultured Holophaga sp.]
MERISYEVSLHPIAALFVSSGLPRGACRGLLAGLPVTEELLFTDGTTVHWDHFTEILDRLEVALGGPQGMESTAYFLVKNSPGLNLMASSFMTLRHLFLDMAPRISRSLYPPIGTQVVDLGKGRILARHIIPAPLRASRAVMTGTVGIYRAYPWLLGQPDAQVEAELSDRELRAVITLPEGGRIVDHLECFFRRFRSASEEAQGQPSDVNARVIMDGLRNWRAYLEQHFEACTDPEEAERAAALLIRDNFMGRLLELKFLERDWSCRPVLPGEGLSSDAPVRVVPLKGAGRVLGTLCIEGQIHEGDPAFADFLSELGRCLVRLLPRRGTSTLPDGIRELLTAREREILRHLLQGLSNKEIASLVGTSPKTVEHQVGAILSKGGFSSRATLLAAVFQGGSGLQH